jgi:hypothetical protein
LAACIFWRLLLRKLVTFAAAQSFFYLNIFSIKFFKSEGKLKSKIITGILLALVCTGTLFSQQDILAVLPFSGGASGEGDTVAELFSGDDGLMRRFGILPRTALSNSIISEFSFQQTSGMTNVDTIAALGVQLGAKYIMSGSITALGTQKLLVVTITKIETIQQVAGAYLPYNRIEDLRGQISSLVKTMLPLVDVNWDSLPKLALAQVSMEGAADTHTADTLAQILSISLLRTKTYSIYPRTSTIEQVQREYKTQHSGMTADRQAAKLGYGVNPEYVLSVVARKLGVENMFNASIIELVSGVQEGPLQSERYVSLADGMQAMEIIAVGLSGQQLSAAELEKRSRDMDAAARAKAAAEKKAARAEKMGPLMKNSGIALNLFGGVNLGFNGLHGTSWLVGGQVGYFYKGFSLQTGVHVTVDQMWEQQEEKDKTSGDTIKHAMSATFSFVQIPLLAQFFLPIENTSVGTTEIKFFLGPIINVASFGVKDDAQASLAPAGLLAGFGFGFPFKNVHLYIEMGLNLDFSETEVVPKGQDPQNFKRSSTAMKAGIQFDLPFKK